MYATGRRKRSTARVFLSLGKGKRIVNDREMKEYFPRAAHIMNIEQPMDLLNVAGLYDMNVTVCGGGDSGQAGAIRLGISRCLARLSEENKKALRKAGFLTRDSREVERKKYGQAKARKRYQFSKR
jgi:small subunit ribosomal protein S9